MRRFVLIACAGLILVWVAVGIWAARQMPPFDVAGLHGIGILFILPALVLGSFGRWLGLAAGLVCFAAFVYLSVLVAGQISNH